MEYLLLQSNTVNLLDSCQVVSCVFAYGNRLIFTKTVDNSIAVLSQQEYVDLLQETARYVWVTLTGSFDYREN